ncbi:transcriptional regulator [Enterobacter sp. ECC-175]|uniref:winged helix-turn-helix domain-containing protein n=1 Tax=Enterobacter sp. ECC-175 TaxID=3116479 RepID=UPI003753EB32
MFFICNNSLLFDPEAHVISPVSQPESAITLSAPAVRLLQEFIRNKGKDLSREELITRVWEAFGFTPSGNNLNKAMSELRKGFQSLGEHNDVIVTVPRYGFRFEADVSCQPKKRFLPADPVPEPNASVKKPPIGRWPVWGKKRAALAVIAAVAMGLVIYAFSPRALTVPAMLKPVKEKIGQCSIWLINDHGRPLVLSKMEPLLEANNVACHREAYNIYYFSARFTIAAADEVFIGACPVSPISFCKTIRYKSGAEQ